jgi:hypothetical protein
MMSGAFNQTCRLRGQADPADEAVLTDLLYHYQRQVEEAKSTSATELH